MKSFLSLAALVSLSSFGYGESEKFLQAESHIVGGSQWNENHEMVSLQVFKSDELANDYEWRLICGGALVDKRWVLTAAQCAKEIRDWGVARVSVGSPDLRKALDVNFIGVRRVVLHPEWETAGDARDVALLELEKEVPRISDVRPARVKSRRTQIIEEKFCDIKGWGGTGESADFSSTLKHLAVKLVSTSACQRAYSDVAGVRITNEHICAGRMGERGQGMCQGDLGGPLFCQTKYGVRLVGIATNGAFCGSPRYPGIYSRIDVFIEWIQKTTNNTNIGAWEK